MQTNRAVYWDVDGTLSDSEDVHRLKLRLWAGKHGIVLTNEDFERPHDFAVPDEKGEMHMQTTKLHGAGDKKIYWWMVDKNPAIRETVSIDQYNEELLTIFENNITELKPRKGIATTFNRLHADGVKQCAVTVGAPRQTVANLEAAHRAGMKRTILFAITADDVKKSKPNPEGYLVAKDKMRDHFQNKAAPTLQVAVEDSEAGVKAAIAAGMPCVQFRLAGQKPMRGLPKSQYASATTARGVARHIRRFLGLNKK